MKETELQNGTIDAIWNGYSATDERREKVAFSIPYMENQQVLVTKKSQQIRSVEDMKDKTLGAQAGSSGYLDFEAQPDLLKNRVKDQKANQYQSFNEALIDLKNDRIDALLIDRVYANYYLQSEGILNDYNVFSAGFESESFAVGVRPADKRLLQALNQAFVQLYKEGKFQEISQKWFGEDVATKEVKVEIEFSSISFCIEKSPDKSQRISDYFIVGKSNTSRIVVVSVRSMQRRSIPIPKPPVGGIPYSRASM